MSTPYFGEPWPSGICDEGVQVETPFGYPCVLCEELIEDGDRGSFMGVIMAGHNVHQRPVHRECSLRNVLGGIGHLNGSSSCPCRGGDDPDDGHTFRESALLVWEWVERNGMPTAS